MLMISDDAPPPQVYRDIPMYSFGLLIRLSGSQAGFNMRRLLRGTEYDDTAVFR